MFTNEFINSEMLAEEYITDVQTIKKLLQEGKFDECSELICEMETQMQVTLAYGERCNLASLNS